MLRDSKPLGNGTAAISRQSGDGAEYIVEKVVEELVQYAMKQLGDDDSDATSPENEIANEFENSTESVKVEIPPKCEALKTKYDSKSGSGKFNDCDEPFHLPRVSFGEINSPNSEHIPYSEEVHLGDKTGMCQGGVLFNIDSKAQEGMSRVQNRFEIASPSQCLDAEETFYQRNLREWKESMSEEWVFYVRKKKLFFKSHIFMWILFLVGAAITGLVSVAFSRVANKATHSLEKWSSNPDLQPLIFGLAPIGFPLILWMIMIYFWGASGSGIPVEMAILEELEIVEGGNNDLSEEVIGKRLKMRDLDSVFGKKIRTVLGWRIAAGKFLLTPLAILLGGSIGVEGPTVQIASCIVYGVFRFGFLFFKPIRAEVLHTAKSRRQYVKAVTLAGGAAGIASAFNTPIAGVVFAIEEMGNNYDRAMGRLILSSVILSGGISMLMDGGNRYFGYVMAFATPQELIISAVFATIMGSVLGGLWSLTLYILLKLKRRMAILSLYPLTVSFVFALLFALTGYVSGSQVYGSGYTNTKVVLEMEITYCNAPSNISQIMENDLPLSFFVVKPSYGFSKMLATLFAYLTGIPGGIFSPSLSAGAGWGSLLYCEVIRHITPNVKPSIVAILTMQGYFSGVTQSPLTAYTVLQGTVLFAEDDSKVGLEIARLFVSLMAASLSRIVMPKSLYGAIAELGIPPIPSCCIAPDLQSLKEEQEARAKTRKTGGNGVSSRMERIASLFREESWY